MWILIIIYSVASLLSTSKAKITVYYYGVSIFSEIYYSEVIYGINQSVSPEFFTIARFFTIQKFTIARFHCILNLRGRSVIKKLHGLPCDNSKGLRVDSHRSWTKESCQKRDEKVRLLQTKSSKIRESQ